MGAVAGDITPSEHVRMQAAMQAFVDNSMSKTCNLPAGATEEDVAACYVHAWKLGCKGITVYATGSRNVVVIETKKDIEAKKKQAEEAKATETPQPSPPPTSLRGSTQIIKTPVGKAYVTVNEDQGRQPFEVFINTAKAGSETAAVSEAFGRLISYTLRINSPVESTDRLKHIVKQLSGIGG